MKTKEKEFSYKRNYEIFLKIKKKKTKALMLEFYEIALEDISNLS